MPEASCVPRKPHRSHGLLLQEILLDPSGPTDAAESGLLATASPPPTQQTSSSLLDSSSSSLNASLAISELVGPHVAPGSQLAHLCTWTKSSSTDGASGTDQILAPLVGS